MLPVVYLLATPFYSPNSFFIRLEKRLCAKTNANEILKNWGVESFNVLIKVTSGKKKVLRTSTLR